MPLHAVLFYATDDPTFNTTPPTKTFTNSGWQYVGQWGQFCGTVIAPKYFITAFHIGGSIGDPFIFHGVTNITTDTFPDPQNDVTIWKVTDDMSPVAPFYTKRKERGKGVVVIGRGTLRGAEVRTADDILHGWQWGHQDEVQRWGRSVVSGFITNETRTGDLLRMQFKAKSKSSGIDASAGDSGGPVFIKDGKTWKLAGVNAAVSGPYNTNTLGDGFMAAIFDVRGLYVGGSNAWTQIPQKGAKVPGSFYSVRISSRTNWINEIIQQP